MTNSRTDFTPIARVSLAPVPRGGRRPKLV
jgi:hypothetical protein